MEISIEFLQFFSHPIVNLILATLVFDGFYLKLFILFIQQKHEDLVFFLPELSAYICIVF